MSFKLKNNFFLYKNISLNITLSLISQMYRILEEDTSSNSDNQTSAEENKKRQLRELYIYIAVLAGIIIIILVGYALYRKCVERKALQQLELEYQAMIYNIINNNSEFSSSFENSHPKSYNGNPEIPENEMRSEYSESDNHEERIESLRKKYGNRVLIKCLLKKQIETIEYTKKLEENFGDKCTICMDGFKIGINIYKTPCEHIFHFKCFDKYLNGINKEDKLVCPNCNQNLLINKKYIKLRAKRTDVKNQRIINKEDNGKEIVINNSVTNKEIKIKDKEIDKERIEIIHIKKIANNINKDLKDINADNIYNPLKLRRSENMDEKEDTKNKSKKSIIFNNNQLKKSSDSKGALFYSRNTDKGNNAIYATKMNSERHDILTKELKEEEKKES